MEVCVFNLILAFRFDVTGDMGRSYATAKRLLCTNMLGSTYFVSFFTFIEIYASLVAFQVASGFVVNGYY